MSGPERPEGGAVTHCEWCGADYEDAPEAPGAAPRTAPRPAPPATGESEPATHCEWCGAEYPVPGAET